MSISNLDFAGYELYDPVSHFFALLQAPLSNYRFTMLIRKALPEDSEHIADLLMLATGEVIRKMIGEKNREEAKLFLQDLVNSEHNQYSYQNCLLAVTEGKIVGVLLGYEGEKLTELRKPVLDQILIRFGTQPKVEDETQSGEFYLDSIAVSPAHQRQGIGTKLIQFVITQKASEEGQTLGLLVDKSNPEAKRLYQKLGFQSVGEKTLMGISLDHLQRKPDWFKKSLKP